MKRLTLLAFLPGLLSGAAAAKHVPSTLDSVWAPVKVVSVKSGATLPGCTASSAFLRATSRS